MNNDVVIVKAQAFDLITAEQQQKVQLLQLLQAIGQVLGISDYAQIIPQIEKLKSEAKPKP